MNRLWNLYLFFVKALICINYFLYIKIKLFNKQTNKIFYRKFIDHYWLIMVKLLYADIKRSYFLG